MNDCTFTCNLTKGAHYIDGHSLTKEKPNLYINSCNYSTNEEGELNNKFAKIDLRNQVFSSRKNCISKYDSSKMIVVISFLVAVIIIALAIFISKLRRYNEIIGKDSIEA